MDGLDHAPLMQKTLSLLTPLGRTTLNDSEYEVFAEADGEYDSSARQLSISLEAYLRPDDITRLSERVCPPWLPRPQVDREHVSQEETSELAREVFHRWCDKVRATVPNLHP